MVTTSPYISSQLKVADYLRIFLELSKVLDLKTPESYCRNAFVIYLCISKVSKPPCGSKSSKFDTVTPF